MPQWKFDDKEKVCRVQFELNNDFQIDPNLLSIGVKNRKLELDYVHSETKWLESGKRKTMRNWNQQIHIPSNLNADDISVVVGKHIYVTIGYGHQINQKMVSAC